MSKAIDRLAVKLAQGRVKAYVRREGGRFEAVSAYRRKYEGLIDKTGSPTTTPTPLKGIVGKTGVATPAPRPLKGSPGRALTPPTFTPAQAARAQEIETKVEQGKKDGLETDKQFAVQVGTTSTGKPVYTWDPKRQKQHDEIIAHFWSQEFEKVPSEGKAVISGGIGGAGKSTILKSHADIERDAYGTVNPDDIKEYMAEKGMVPKIAGLDPMEASALVHEESSYLATRLAERAYGEKKNMIWDITMNRPNSVQERLDALNKYGYSDIKAVFVDIPVETSVKRAIGRWWQGYEDPDVKIGGRYVSPTLIRSQAAGQGGTLNRRVFDKFRPKFDSWELWSTEGPLPKQIDSSKSRTSKT